MESSAPAPGEPPGGPLFCSLRSEALHTGAGGGRVFGSLGPTVRQVCCTARKTGGLAPGSCRGAGQPGIRPVLPGLLRCPPERQQKVMLETPSCQPGRR